MKPSVLVLGAADFLGRHVARRFDTMGYDVHGTPRPEGGEGVDIAWHDSDLEVDGTLQEAMEACEVVVDCAGFEPTDAFDLDGALRRGVGRLRRVLDACRRHRIGRVVYLSSPATLGVDSADGAEELTESDFYVPGSVDDAFFDVKFSMEAELYRYLNDGLPVVVAIPGALVGPGGAETATGQLIRQLAAGRLPAVIDGTFNAVDVRDLAESVVSVLERGRPGRRYILGGENVGIAEFVRRAAAACGVPPPERRLPAGLTRRATRIAERVGRRVGWRGRSALIGLDTLYYTAPLSIERAEAELDHRPRSLDGTLADTVEWLRSDGHIADE